MNWRAQSDVEVPVSPMNIPQTIWRALFSRGYTEAQKLEKLFSPSLQDLKDPFSLKDMKKACERLKIAFDQKEKIVIYADFDLDGTSGLALLYEGLRSLGFQNLLYYQPKRLSEGYGLHVHAIEELAKQEVKVIVTVDVGITALDAAQKAKELGLDLIITDHHLPYEALPKAFAVINPNQKECSSGLGYLCGAGVAFYLLMALKKTVGATSNLKEVLDFFVIGTLTDLVPLMHDNRVLVKHGLIKLEQTQRPALKQLLQALNLLGRKLTSQDVAISLAPKLNALSRMEAQVLPRDVLLETNPEKAEEIVDLVLQTQELRKHYQKNAIQKALELSAEMSQEGYVWVWSHEFHKGVIGLVATSLSETHQRPTFVGSINEKGEISGSARLPDGSDIDLTKVLEGAHDLLLKYGGHAQAAGFSLRIENAILLDEFLENYFSKLPLETKERFVIYDSKAQFEDISPAFMKWLEALEPFGKDFPAFQFLFEKVQIVNIRTLNGGHLKLTLRQGTKNFSAIVFSPSTKFKNLNTEDIIDIIAEPKWNYFNGSRTIQLALKDVRVE